jgi:hypothetical protein
MQKLLTLFFSFCLMLLTACEQSMVLETSLEIPEPIETKLPLNMAIFYEESLREYIYTENNDDRRNWSITIGPSQIAIFDQVLPSMFNSIDAIQSLDNTNNQQYDAIIIPELKDIQFALPYETKTKIHETWIKYIIHIQDPNGADITDLNLSGYGKSPPNTSVEFLLDEREGLIISTNEAYRDLAAKIIVSFQSDPDIQIWLTKKTSRK